MDDGELYRSILDGVHDGVYVVAPDRTITYWNAGAERLVGYSQDQAVGRQCFDGMLNHIDGAGNRLCGARCPLRATILDGRDRQAHVYAHHADGHLVPLHVRATAIHDETGAIVGAVETFSDEAPTVALREQLATLRERVDTDPLTGLANRSQLDATLGRLLAYDRTRRSTDGPGIGVLFVDLDDFKLVNDTHGHATGDNALRALACTLVAACRPGDLVARYGGDEFVLVIRCPSDDALTEVAARVLMLIREMRIPGPRGEAIPLTASVGGATARLGDDAASLLNRADNLVYRAKANGRDGYACERSSHGRPPTDGAPGQA